MGCSRICRPWRTGKTKAPVCSDPHGSCLLKNPLVSTPGLKQYAFCRQSSVCLVRGCFLSFQNKITCQFFLFPFFPPWLTGTLVSDPDKLKWASLVAHMVRNLPAMQESHVQSLGQECPLVKGVATLSSILAWRIPWTEEPGRLWSMGSQRDGDNRATDCSHAPWIPLSPIP